MATPGFEHIESLFSIKRRGALVSPEPSEQLPSVSAFEGGVKLSEESLKRSEQEFAFDDQTDQLLKRLAAS